MIIVKTFILFIASLCLSSLAWAVEAKLVGLDTVTVYQDGKIFEFKFPGQIRDFRVKTVEDSNSNTALIVLAKCGDENVNTHRWYFQFRGFFGSSTTAVELGVPPPPESNILEIRYLYGDTFGFKLSSKSGKDAATDWYYVTSCPPRAGKDYVGAYLHPNAQAMMTMQIGNRGKATNLDSQRKK